MQQESLHVEQSQHKNVQNQEYVSHIKVDDNASLYFRGEVTNNRVKEATPVASSGSAVNIGRNCAVYIEGQINGPISVGSGSILYLNTSVRNVYLENSTLVTDNPNNVNYNGSNTVVCTPEDHNPTKQFLNNINNIKMRDINQQMLRSIKGR